MVGRRACDDFLSPRVCGRRRPQSRHLPPHPDSFAVPDCSAGAALEPPFSTVLPLGIVAVLTDTLARDVFIVRGRVTDPDKPWVDHASYSIPVQYSLMHYAGRGGRRREGTRRVPRGMGGGWSSGTGCRSGQNT